MSNRQGNDPKKRTQTTPAPVRVTAPPRRSQFTVTPRQQKRNNRIAWGLAIVAVVIVFLIIWFG